MGDAAPQVDPCKQEPCKSSLADYEAKLKALKDAQEATQKLLDNPPKAMATAAGVAGVACGVVGTGIVLGFWWTGVGAGIGVGIAWAGAALAALSARLATDWKAEVDAARAACAKAHDAFERAKDKVTSDCPKQCWPKWVYPTCP